MLFLVYHKLCIVYCNENEHVCDIYYTSLQYTLFSFQQVIVNYKLQV